MPPLKIIADEAIPFLKGVLEPYARIEYRPGRDFSSTDIRDADVLLIRTRTRCNQQLLKGSPVRMIVTATIGFDHIDLDYCQQQGIEVVTAAGCNARGVLQYIGATLAHLSRLQGWTPKDKTLGIIGVGHVGSLIDEYARAWGFRVITCDPPRQLREHGDFLPLEEVARQADILTFHTPLDETTRHMVGTSLLRQVKSGTLIINASRGEVVDEEALLASGLPYVLDVWEHEPDLNPHPARSGTARHTTHSRLLHARQSQRDGHERTGHKPTIRLADKQLVSPAHHPIAASRDRLAATLRHD